MRKWPEFSKPERETNYKIILKTAENLRHDHYGISAI
jgi:hypothetical protein